LASETSLRVPDRLAALAAFHSARFMLRPLVPEEAEALRALSDDPAVAAAIPFLTQPFTLAAAQALIRKNGGGEDCFLGVWQRSGEALVGVVGLHLRGAGDLELGYWIGRRFRGQGYASEAAAAALECLGTALPRRRVIVECRPENLGSWRLLEKLGFRPTGEMGTRPGRRLLARPVALNPS
jgi:RimJ/RimL family protein N-acetyltransferase